MLLRILFWGALLSAAMGMNSPDGNLFFFIAVHLTMVATGRLFYRRDKRSRSGAASKASAGGVS